MIADIALALSILSILLWITFIIALRKVVKMMIPVLGPMMEMRRYSDPVILDADADL